MFVNAGDGTFAFTGQCLGVEVTEDIVLGDVDRDGDLDVATVTSGFGDSRLWLNQGDGNFVASPQEFGSGHREAGAAAGDFDGDGDLDLVMPTLELSGDNQLWINQGGAQGGGEGSFLPAAQPPFSDSWSPLASADFDGDGDLDVVLADFGGLRLWANDGSGAFSTDGSCRGAATESPLDLEVADLDGDGAPDLVVGKGPTSVTPENFRAPMAEVWIARSVAAGLDLRHTGQCFAYGDESVGGPRSLFSLLRLALGDVDGDGAIDAVGANDDGVRIWRNGGPPPATGYQRCCSIETAILGAGYICPLAAASPPAGPSAPSRGSSWRGLDPAGVDLGTFRALRDDFLPARADGQRFVDLYASWDLEVFLLLALDGDLRRQGFDALALWQDDLAALLGGTGSGATASQAEVDAIEAFLLALHAAASPGLAQALDVELDRLPPLQTFVGLDVETAATIVAGPAAILFADGFESGDTGAWSATVP